MQTKILKISNLSVSTEDERILKGLNLDLEKGKTHVLMGPNGSGKSTLAHVLMGHPNFIVEEGTILYKEKELLALEPHERAQEGIFMSFQHPVEVPGVSIPNYLRMIHNKKFNINLSPVRFRKLLKEKLSSLDIDENLLNRYLNEGFSGGEKKRMEILQLLVTEPDFVILDEIDSGLDIDAIRVVSNVINKIKRDKKITVLLITHYTRILKHIEPDFVYIMQDGKITKSGDKSLAHDLEEKGYAPFGE